MKRQLKLNCIISVALLFMVTGNIFSQVPYFRQVTLTGTSIGFKINAICQDSSRFVWLATNDGLWKNDGVGFVKVRLPKSLQNSSISAIFPVSRHVIFAGTSEGKLFSVSDDSITTINIPNLREGVAISSIFSSGKGEIWYATLGQGVYRILAGKTEHYTTAQGLGDDYVYDVFMDAKGILWVGSDGGLSYSSKSKSGYQFTNLSTKNGLPENIIRKVVQGPGNTIGIGMEEMGFCFYDYPKNKFILPGYFAGWNKGPVTALLKMENEFWIGTQKFGITDFEFQGKRRMRQFYSEEGFRGVNVNAITSDHEGNIWIGAGGELYMSPGEKIEFKHSLGGIALKNMHTILLDKNLNIWFSNDSGLFCYKSNLDENAGLFSPLNNTKFRGLNVISLYEDQYGYIWIGTFDHGVIRYDPATSRLRAFTEGDGLINSNVLSIDGTGNVLWFATLGGVSKCVLPDSAFDGEILFSSYSEEHGLGNNFIYKVFVDSRKRVWFGTDGQGITCYDKGTFSNFSESQGLKSKIIYSITEDSNGSIWLSSSGEGVYRFDGKSFRNISLEQGLSDLNITSIATDRKGNILIIHKKGVDVINPDNFHLLSYGSEMGINNIDPDLNVVDVDTSGLVWIGTSNGIIKFNLEERVGEKKPVLILKNVLCYLEKIDTADTHIFAYNRNHISFDYATLWFAEPKKISYQYKLEGYNQEWITTGDRFVTFPNLRPGDYEFKVRTSVNNNFTNSEEASYKFKIQWPIWQRPWFLSVIASAFALILFFYVRFRDEKLKAAERLKKEKIESQYEILKNQVNPHFLFNSFNTLITVIENDQSVAIEYVNKLSDFFRSILTFREKDLISLDEELELVETYVFLQQKRYGNNFSVDINIPPGYRQQCLIPPLALQLLIENCLKHNAISRETKLLVEIYVEDNNYLVIRNTINPKIIKEPSTGIGLQNLKNRYQLISNVSIKIIEDDQHFSVKLPLIKL